MKLFNYLKDKEYREYSKMTRRHRRELMRMARKSGDYDYSFLHNLVVLKLKQFYEFYEANHNVWQTDEYRLDVMARIKECLDKAEEIENCNIDDEMNLYNEFYTLIGKHIMCWWD